MSEKARPCGISWPAPSFFHARPLLCGALAYSAGIALCRAMPYAWWLWALGPALLPAAFYLRNRARAAAVFFALLGMAALGLARGGAAIAPPPMPPLGSWTVTGTVEGGVTQTDRAVTFYLRDPFVEREGEAPVSLRGKVYCYYATKSASRLSHGQTVRVSGASYAPQTPRNPGGFDEALWLAQQGAHVRLYATGAPRTIQEAAGFSLRGAALSISRTLAARMDALFGDVSPVMRAMLLGDAEDVPEEWNGWLRDSGVIHLLAVSGLHVGLWYLLLKRLLRPLPVSPAVRWVLLGLVLAAYAFVVGLQASVLRASLMLLSLEGGLVVGKKRDPLTALSLAALCILLLRPLELFAAGFQLSVTAMLGLVLLRPALQRALGYRPSGMADGFFSSISAQLGILPAAARWFGQVSLVGILLNVAAIPLAGLLIPVAAVATALDAVWTPLGWFFAQASRGMATVLLWLAKAAAAAPGATFRLGAFSPWLAAIFFAALALCSTAVVWRWRARLGAMALAVCLLVSGDWLLGKPKIRYVQLDVGQALAGVLHVGGHTYVYDCGEAYSDLASYLAYTGQDVDGLFLSHPHTDHTAGLDRLFEAGIRVHTVFVPENADAFGAEPEYERRLRLAEEMGARIVALSAGDALTLGGLPARVIAPEKEALRGSDPNDRSLVLLVEIGGDALLLCGDADGAAEPLGIDCTVLQVAHHGSRNAAGAAFLETATPEIALVSVGKNSYGHPHPEALERLEGVGAQIHLTRDSGALTVYFGAQGAWVEGYVK